MAMNVTPFVGTDNFNMETFNNMISQINSGVNSEISDVLAQLGTKAKIQTGSYVGTGTYGADNPCSLTFDFEPHYIIVANKSFNLYGYQHTPSGFYFWFDNISGMQVRDKYIGNGYGNIAIAKKNNTLNITTSSDMALFNASGKTYYYIAFG